MVARGLVQNGTSDLLISMSIQLSFAFGKPPDRRPQESAHNVLVVGRRQWQVTYVRHRRARHYILRLADDGSVRVTIPRGGSRKDAERFAAGKAGWIEREQYRREMARGAVGSKWDTSLRPQAERDLPARLTELAAQHGYRVAGVTVRNQRSRWGSCSPAGRISLNWRLVQVPHLVRDYVLLHELTHLAVSNHSPKFWKTLEAVCPWHREARAWLRARHISGCD
jgi:predicted metal-dependent hydrolase